MVIISAAIKATSLIIRTDYVIASKSGGGEAPPYPTPCAEYEHLAITSCGTWNTTVQCLSLCEGI